MQMSGEYRIEAPRARVWEMLNDPEVLRQSIPGCEELTKSGDDTFDAKVRAKVGPVSAKFNGHVTLSDINPPESYTISGEGKGGAAGFAKGGAKVRLDEEGDATLLKYEVDAKVGGKLAQLGSRLIEGTARKMADDFFGRFAELAGAGAQPAAEPAAEAPSEPTPEEEREMAGAAMAGAAPGHAAPQGAPVDAGRDHSEGAGAREAAPAAPARRRLSPAAWVALLVALVIVLLVIFGI